MEFMHAWLILFVVNLVALMSPGPDFVMAVRNSVLYSRKAGIYTALGFAGGIVVHVFYSLVGLATIISQSVMLFSIIKYIGAGYLIYIGMKALFSNGFDKKINLSGKTKTTMSNVKALRSGFVTNLFNPKATMYFLALFTQIIDPSTPFEIQLLYGATCVISTFIWFSIVAIVLTNQKIQKIFLNFTQWIDRICGGLLIALGIKLAVSKV